MLSKLMLAAEMASCLGGIDVKLVSEADGSLAALIQSSFYDFTLSLVSERGIMTYLEELEPGCVYLLSGILGLCFIVIRLQDSNQFLFAGPCQMDRFSESKVRSSLRPYKLSSQAVQRVVSYCRWQPVLSQEKLHQLGLLIARHVLELPEPIRYEYMTYHFNKTDHPSFLLSERYVDHSQIRQIEMRYEASAAMTEAIKQGNLALALRILRDFDSGMSSVVRNPDPVRNAQNFCIVLNTQLRHAMEENKIHPYRLDMVSNEIATHIETLKTLEDVGKYYPQIIRRYCELALEKNYSHLESFSRQVVVYIKTHLTDNLTVKNTARALLVNANYLSGKFHQQVGMTFTDFVNQQRVEQAASLLKHTNMQVQQIAAAVGYNHTSYFAKQFLRFHGVTPREYRSKGTI